jgi:hypothetical protein
VNLVSRSISLDVTMLTDLPFRNFGTPCSATSTPTDTHLSLQLASTDSRDWVKISEMFLGKSPADFNFIPKHKSNSYGSGEGGEDNQG